MPNDRSYGIIPLQRSGKGWRVLLVQHGSGHWSFPKGHAEPGEDDRQAAVRELFEETGLAVKEFLEGEPVYEEYFFTLHGKRIHKVVTYFLAEVEGKVIAQQAELIEAKWFPLEDAANQVTYPAAKAICQQVIERL